ncbi:MAG: GNAT family N-acetyltransferase [Bacteroidota bacterium]
MKIIEVADKKTREAFYQVARDIYKNDSNWTCPLDIEIEGIFDPAGNKCFKTGNAMRWILEDGKGAYIGRIAAFYDQLKANVNNDQPTGGIGFFECSDNQDAANLLFDTACKWLKDNKMEAMDGPITFGENITNWGLLIEGFMHQGYGMQYHHPYYKKLFESYGFQEYFQQYTYHKDLSEPFPERQEKFARHVGEKGSFVFERFSQKNRNKYLESVTYIFNEVWKDFHEDYVPLEMEDIEKIFDEAKPIIDENIIHFAFDDGKPVAMVIVLPDVNQVLKKLNGKLTLINKIRFVLNKKKIDRARLLITGVIPSYQRTYIIGALFMQMIDSLIENKYRELEMSWVGDYNITVNKIYSTLGIPIVKKHATYRYLFDRNKEFRRFTNETSNKTKKILRKQD